MQCYWLTLSLMKVTSSYNILRTFTPSIFLYLEHSRLKFSPSGMSHPFNFSLSKIELSQISFILDEITTLIFLCLGYSHLKFSQIQDGVIPSIFFYPRRVASNFLWPRQRSPPLFSFVWIKSPQISFVWDVAQKSWSRLFLPSQIPRVGVFT